MGGGGKGGSSVQTVSIPPEVLARYNAVNARAENVATTPFSPYATTPEAFVAPLSTSQQAGMANINALQGSANQAVGAGQNLQGQGISTAQQAQAQAQGVNMAALQGISQAQQQGTAYNQAAGQNIGNAMGSAAPFMQGNAALQQQGLAQQQGYQNAATQNIGNIAASAQPYLQGNAALQQQGLAQQQGFQNAAAQNIGNIAASAQPYLQGNAALQQQGLAQQQGYQRAATQNAAGITQAAQPYLAQNIALQQQGLAQQQGFQNAAAQNAANIAASAEPYLSGNAALQQQGYTQQQAAQNAAIQNAMSIAGAGSPAQQENMGLQRAGLGQQQEYQRAATQNIGQAMSSAAPYMQEMAGLTRAGLGQGQQYLAGATDLTQQAIQTGRQYANKAEPFYTGALQAAQPFNQGSAQLTQAALQSAQPLNQQAQQYLGAGAQAVGPQELNYGQYMNPFLSNVVQAQQALQAQENAAQRSAMQGKAVQSGAFGGDRAGIEQANLARQQSLANQATLSNLLQSGFGQAQAAAQQQQGVNLAAAQANRAAQQQAAQQAAALGQQNFAQNLGAAQQAAALGQQNYAQTLGVGTNLAALGQQQYGQNLGTGAQINQLGQTGFQQNLGAGAQLGQVGQNLFNQNITQGQALAGLGMQGLQAYQSTGQNIGAAGMNLASLQAQQAQQMSNIGQQALQAGQTTGTNLGNIGMNRATLQGQQAQQMAALGQQGLAALQGTGTNIGAVGLSQSALQGQQAQQMAALGQQGLAATQGTGTNLGAIGMNQAALQGQQGQGLAALGQQGLAALQGTGTNLGNIGQQLFGQNIAQGQAIQGLGQQQFAQGLAGAQGAANIGQNMFGQGAQTAGIQQAGGMNIANLGLQNQGAQIGAAQAQMAAGQQQQQTEQAARTALYNQYLQQQGYPFQIAQFLANIAEGTGSLSGSTTTAQRTGYRGGRMGDGYASGGLVPPNSQGGIVYNPGAYGRGGYEEGGNVIGWDNDGRPVYENTGTTPDVPLVEHPADVPSTPAEVSQKLADAAKTDPALQQNISDYQAVSGVNKDVSSAFKDATGKDIDAASARKYQDMLNAGMSLDQVKYNINTSQPALLQKGDVGALKGQSLAYNPANFSTPSAPVLNQFGSYAAPAPVSMTSPQQASGKGASQPQTQNYYGGGYNQPSNYGMPNFGNYGGAPNYAGAAYYGGQQQYGYQPQYQQPQQASGKGASQPQPQPTYQPPQATGKGASQPAQQAPTATGKGMSTGGRAAFASGGRAGYLGGGPIPGDPYGILQAQQASFAGAPGAAMGYVPSVQGGAGQYKMMTPQASILPREQSGLKEAIGMGTSIASLGEAGTKLYDKLAKNSTTGAVPDTFSEGMSNLGDKFKNFFGLGEASGGRIGYAGGGIPGLDDLKQGYAAIPGGTGEDTPMGKVVSQGTQTPAELKNQMDRMSSGSGGLGGGSSSGGVGDIIKTGASLASLGNAAFSAGSWIGTNILPALFALKRGGRVGKAGGGALVDPSNPRDQAMAASFDNLLQRYDNNPLLAAAAMDVGTKAVDAAIMKAKKTGRDPEDFLPRRTQEYMFALSKAAIGAHDAMTRQERKAGGRTGHRDGEFVDEPATGLAPAPKPSPSEAMTTGDVLGGLAPQGAGVQVAGPAPAADKGPDYDAIIGRASKETGIPANLLRAQIQQESSFNPNAVGKSGEIGLTQVLPSTAKKPGFGMAGVDPETLRDPEQSIMFGAKYLAARGQAAGVKDWNNPDEAAKGLRAYNGGGDPNYVANVYRHMGLTPPANVGEQKPIQTAGLAGGTKTDAGPFERTFGKAMPDSVPTDSSFWVPLIAGLGTFLASDKYRFSQRLGEGLVGGAAAYGKQQEFGLNKERLAQQAAQNAALMDIKRQELGITAATSGINALKFLQSRYLPKYDAANNIIGYKDTTGGTDINVQDFQKMMQQASSSLQSAAPGASILNTLSGQINKVGQPSGATQSPAAAQPAAGAQPPAAIQPAPEAQAPTAAPAAAAPAAIGPNGPAVDMSKPETLQNRIDWLTDRIAEIGASNPSLTAARQSELQKLQNQQSELLKLSPEMTALAAKRKAAEEGAQTSVKSQYSAKDAAAANAQLASTLVQQSNQMLDTMFDPKTGKPVVSTGPIGPEIARVAGIAKQLGVDPDLINKFTNAEKSQEIEKLAVQMATEIGRQTLGAQNPMRQAEFMQFLKSVPSLGISAEAFRDIVNNTILPQSRMQIERWKHVSDMDPAEKNIQKELLQYELDNPWYVPKTIPSDPSQRIVGQVYESNGKRAKWTGSGWDVGQ